MVQGGDTTTQNGYGGESIYGTKFKDGKILILSQKKISTLNTLDLVYCQWQIQDQTLTEVNFLSQPSKQSFF
jgi:hypothetical protein